MFFAFLIFIFFGPVYPASYTYPPDIGPDLCKNDHQIHFIIAGAGSAGSVLAKRLSEVPSWNILLLELGTDHITNNTEIPIFWVKNLKSDLDYDYKSEPSDKIFQGLDGKRCCIPRGKGSGGSSMINAVMYLRGAQKDFDDWEAMGCHGWNYESTLPYFMKAENYQGSIFNPRVHGTDGPLTISPFYSSDPAIKIMMDAYSEKNLRLFNDLDAPLQTGYGFVDSNTRDGMRCSTFKAYLSSSKPNLFYGRNVLVRKVVFEPDSKKVIGVEITAPNGKTCTIKAQMEVILSLGTIVSPQILMLSGIGPQEHLKAMGIPVVQHLLVGSNYHDQTSYPGLVFTDRKNRPPEEIKKESDKIIQDIGNLISKGLPTLGISKLMVFVNTKNDGSTLPDIQIITDRIPYKSLHETENKQNILYNIFGVSKEVGKLYEDFNNQADILLPMIILPQVKSRGYIQLRSLDPLDPPKIYPNFLSDPDDVDTLLRGVRFIQQISQTKSMTNAGLTMEFMDYKACKIHPPDSDQYWICAFHQICTGFFHPQGTCRMGAEDDPEAVLNPRLQVKGISGLRVIDGSAISKTVSVNPHASIIMLAEKAADIIKQHYGVIC